MDRRKFGKTLSGVPPIADIERGDDLVGLIA
jgi:hypothetical protein